jgi:hypothetical protein
MRRIRIFALGIVSFFAVLMGALLAPGTFVNRALSAALCTVFSFSSTVCTVNLAKSSDRVVAATPPAVERNISDWLVQRDPGEFDDAPSAPSGSNPQAPPFPQDPGPNQPVRPDFDNPGSGGSTSTLENQVGFQDAGSGNAILRFLDEGNCINDYYLTRAIDGYPYAQSVSKAVPIDGRCTENSVLLTAKVTSDLDEIVFISSNNSPPLKIQGLNSNSWKITYTDQSSVERSETVQLPLQSSLESKEQSLQVSKNENSVLPTAKVTSDLDEIVIISSNSAPHLKIQSSLNRKVDLKKTLLAKIDCAYMDKQKRNCEQGRRFSEGLKYIINATVGGLSGGPKFALEKLVELTGAQLPKYPKIPPVPKPVRLPVAVAGSAILIAQQIAEGLMSLTCSIAFGDRYNNDFVKWSKDFNPDFANWLANTQMYTERRLNEDCATQTVQQPQQTASVVTARISQVDDVARIYVDGKIVFEGFYAYGGKGGDTGWQPINVGSGRHQVRLVVENTYTGESGGWFEIKVNGELKINQGRPFQKDQITGTKYDQTTTLEVP